jgi:uncharacterized protein
MRIVQFIIFFSIVLTVHLLVNYYIYSRGLRTFEPGTLLRKLYIFGFWLLAASFFLGRVLEKVYLSHLSDLFTWAGSFWLAAMLYLFLAVFMFDLLRLADKLFPFLHHLQPGILSAKPYLITIGTATIVFFIVLAGHINAIYPRLHKVAIDAGSNISNRESLRIAMASDIHLGTIVGQNRLSRMVKMINETNADIILLSGDILDEDLAPVIRQNLGETLSKLKAPLGVYGVTGNHEYIGGAESAVKYLEQNGITMLRDTTLHLFDNVYLAGREDYESRRFAGFTRKSVQEIIEGLPQDAFVIMMDHQPVGINEAVDNKIGMILSGHTHHGQLWPLNYVTQALFVVSYGYKKINDTHVYVSSGLGSWGPPVRIGNRPEVVEITLNFK